MSVCVQPAHLRGASQSSFANSVTDLHTVPRSALGELQAPPSWQVRRGAFNSVEHADVLTSFTLQPTKHPRGAGGAGVFAGALQRVGIFFGPMAGWKVRIPVKPTH